MPKFSVDFKFRSGKKQVAKVRISEIESKRELDSRVGVQPLSAAAESNANTETGSAESTEPTPTETDPISRSPWPLSALLIHRKWDRIRQSAENIRRRSLSPFNSFIRHHNTKHELNVVIPDDSTSSDVMDYSRSPLQKFNLCKSSYYTRNTADWVPDTELNERREFIVVLAASLQKFGAATHLTEAFTDAVAKARESTRILHSFFAV